MAANVSLGTRTVSDDNVIHLGLIQVQGGKNSVDIAAHEQVRSSLRTETGRGDVPEITRVQGTALKVKHSVILRNEVKIASGTRDAHEFGQHSICEEGWNGGHGGTR